MKHTSIAIIIVVLISPLALGADNLISDGSTGSWQLIDNNGVRWNAGVAYTTNGSGDVVTLGGLLASTDDVIGDLTSGYHQLIDNAGKRWGIQVLYTTDGNGNVIPIASGGGVSSVSGTAPVVSSGGSAPAISMAKATSSVDGYLFHTDWATFNAKQSALSFSSPLVNTSGSVSCNAASGSQPGCLSSADWSAFNSKFSLPSLSAGSILFSDGATISQDNSNLNWSDLNGQMTIVQPSSVSGAYPTLLVTQDPGGSHGHGRMIDVDGNPGGGGWIYRTDGGSNRSWIEILGGSDDSGATGGQIYVNGVNSTGGDAGGVQFGLGYSGSGALPEYDFYDYTISNDLFTILNSGQLSAPTFYTTAGVLHNDSGGLITTSLVSPADVNPSYYLPTTADEAAWNSKQAAGNYLTQLTGDVAASGPGSAAATIQALAVTNAKIANGTIDLTAKVAGLLPNANLASVPAPEIRYVDFLLGSDVACPASPCGDGSSMRPWHSLQHAYDSVTDESTNKPYAFILSGNSDPDTTTITAKPNIALYAHYQVNISQPFTVGPDDVPGIGNDVLNFTNITFLYAFSFVKNDASVNTIFAVNTDFNSGPTIKQNGSGSIFFSGSNITANNAEFKIGDTGALFFNPYFTGTTTFDDATGSAYYQFMGGYLGGQMTITGAPFVYNSGMMIDTSFGASWTNVHSANGDPTIQFDSAGLPASVTGAYASVLTSFSQYVGYTPAVSAQWSTVPSTVKGALDSVRVLSQSAVGSQPACSSANRGLQWLVQGGAGVADIYQVCQKNSSDAYVWTTH